MTCEGDGVYELKNIATCEEFRGQGYGRRLIEHLFEHYRGRCRVMLVGTGDRPRILRFYERCGFSVSHRVENFFIDNYDHPVLDCGERLVDMVYLRKEFRPSRALSNPGSGVGKRSER